MGNYGAVIIHNDAWDFCRIQVRVGKNPDCNGNSQVADTTLSRGNSFKWYAEGANVCWRRPSNPDHPEGDSWTNWYSTVALTSNDEDVYL